MKLIDKDALVAEIERLFKKANSIDGEYANGAQHTLITLKDFIDSLKVKEVDINEEAKRKWDSFSLCYDESRGCDVAVWPYWVYKQVCKYFFKLGLKAKKGE